MACRALSAPSAEHASARGFTLALAGSFGNNTGMPATPVEEQTHRRFQPPCNVQFSVFLDMRVGKMLELLNVFTDQALTVAGLSVLDATDHAVIRIITSNSILARRLLARHELPYCEADVLVAELTDDNSLSSLCEVLLPTELNIHYIYPLLVKPRGHSALAIHTDDYVFAGQILRKKMFNLLGENDLGDNATGSDPLDECPGDN